MITDSEKQLEKIFLSYDSILEKLKLLNIKTKSNKEITHKDLRQAINIMVEKHPTCRWKGKRPNRKKYYILIEGYYWLILVYFQNEKLQIDADVDFFTKRIKQYEDALKINPKILWEKDMNINQLENYFHRAYGTIKNNIIKMNKATNGKYKYHDENNKIIISKEGIEWLCKNCFKQKYLELLEAYKMELTEEYIKRGFPYDVF